MSSSTPEKIVILVSPIVRKFVKYIQTTYTNDDDIFFVYMTLDGLVIEVYTSVLVNESILTSTSSHLKLLFPIHSFLSTPRFEVESTFNFSYPKIVECETTRDTLFTQIISFEGNSKMSVNIEALNSLERYKGSYPKIYPYEIQTIDLLSQDIGKIYTNQVLGDTRIDSRVQVCQFGGLCIVPFEEIVNGGVYILDERWGKEKISFEGTDDDWKICENNIQQYKLHLLEKDEKLVEAASVERIVVRSPSVVSDEKYFSLEFTVGNVICLFYTKSNCTETLVE
jgi:hypothetical protein